MSMIALIQKEDRLKQEDELKVMLLLGIAVFLVTLNTTMFNVALPSIIIEYDLISSTASWIVAGYSIIFAVATLTYSRLSDSVPIRKLLIIGLLLLGLASIIGLFAHQFYLLLSARLLQAAGAGAVAGLAIVVVSRYVPMGRRGRAMAYVSTGASLGFGLGPVIGGAITQFVGWNYLFSVTSLVILLVYFFSKWLPLGKAQRLKFDSVGAMLTIVSFVGILLFLSTLFIFVLVLVSICFVLLWKHVHHVPLPFLQPAVIKNTKYLKLVYLNFTGYALHFSTLFLIPIMLSGMYDFDAAAIGVIILPGAMVSAVAAPWIGKGIDQFGNRLSIFLGLGALIIAALSFALFSTISPYAIMFSYVFISLGYSTLTPSVTNEISKTLSKDHVGAGIGFAQLMQYFGGSFGVTVAANMLDWQESLTLTIIYRNTFIIFILMVSISFIVYYRYSQER